MLKKIVLIFILSMSLAPFSYLHGEEEEIQATSGTIEEQKFTSPKFMIKTSDFSFWKDKEGQPEGSEALLGYVLGTIIQKLMIGLGIVSFVILVIGAGFMILAGGQDEYTNRGKSIFTAGILSLIVALSSYYLVALIRFLIY